MKDETKIVLTVDRSGSMKSIKNDAEGGLNSFIEEQKKEGENANISLYQFDDQFEEVYRNKPINEAQNFELHPRNMTALYDAIGRTINNTGEELKNLPEEEKPNKVIVVIVTDGMENASQEFSAKDIKEMMDHQKEKYSWQFIFICSHEDQIKDAETNLGFSKGNVMSMGSSGNSVRAAYSNLNQYMSRTRSMSTTDYSANLDSALSDEEQDANEDE